MKVATMLMIMTSGDNDDDDDDHGDYVGDKSRLWPQ